jgi:hypothetical protein
MRLTTFAMAAVLFAGPAFAQDAAPALAPPSDTLQAIVAKGMTMSIMGMSGNMDFTKDGNFSGFDGQFAGTYKVDGAKLCLTVPGMIENQCTEYPVGKKSGDTFIIQSADIGDIEIAIR